MTPEKATPATRTVEKEIEINAPVEAVWKALAEGEEVARWFSLDAHVTPGVGGDILWSWGGGMDWPSKIEIWEPNHHLRATYEKPPGVAAGQLPPQRLVMDFYLETHAGKTVLCVVHSGFGATTDWDNEYEGVGRGWTVELQSLRHYLENHRGTPRSVAYVRQPTSVSAEEAWRRLMSPQALLHEGSLEKLREGDHYRITAATGDTLEGSVMVHNPPRDFTASAENLNNSLFRILLDDCGVGPQAVVWLSAYGPQQSEVDAFQNRWQSLLRTIFPQDTTKEAQP
jgi:uncharacterized protein YndB with AHSA1/START domain